MSAMMTTKIKILKSEGFKIVLITLILTPLMLGLMYGLASLGGK